MKTNLNRRDFLKTASAATLSALAAGYPRALVAAEAEEKIKPTADTLIVLWLAGGMAHTETFDPKHYSPFARGMKPDAMFSTFPTIDTAVDHIKFTAGLEKIAGVMDRGTLIRSYTAGDLGFILHSRHQYQWHTGYAPPQTAAAPHLGAILARTLGPLNQAVPAFINIGQRFDLGEGEELKAFTTAGFLGSEFGPFNIPFPEQAADAARPPAGMCPSRFDAAIDRSGSYEASTIGRFGLGCLLARRLAEVGARYIEVTTEYIPFLNWDTHENGHTRAAAMKKQIDSPLSQLVLDLETRGLLNRTLIVLASEFSRDAMIEGKPDKRIKDQVEVPDKVEDPKHYGMHRHFTDADCVLLFSGGIKKGHLHGLTD